MAKKENKSNVPIIQDTWVRWVALTTTILAVCAAISSMKGSSNSTKVQIWTTKEANQWQFYQSKSIKKYLMQLQQDDFKAQNMNESVSPKKTYYDGRLKYYGEKIKQYEEEEKGIMNEAKKLSTEQEDFKKRGGQFSNAVMLLQVAIMLSSIAALLKKNPLWYVGLAFGVVGIIFMINGFTLTFTMLL
ncbi:MAG: DUF4337 domain-containing protein [Candidatus Firestonebacteria bacterium]|nr:DUF4337 domain-containing protein [Candidatus Firestonebacteria bacterium]